MGGQTVEILDTTLRDGNKLPFVVLDRHDRLVIARQLSALGVDVIDAGYPAASREERECVELIAREVRGPVVSALSRATREDVEATLEVLRPAARPRLHVFLHVSPTFLREVLHADRKQTLRLIGRCLEAASLGETEVQFSLGEIGQTDRGFVLEAVRAAAEHGAQVISLADTHGCMHPREVEDLVAAVVSSLRHLPEVRVGVHLHNDLGLATAGTLAALEAGARHVEATISGVGPRSGNTPLEEVVFALEAFRDRLGLEHGVHLDQLAPTSELLARLTGVSPHPSKPVLGKYAFHEARVPDTRRGLPADLQELFKDERVGRTRDAVFSEQDMSRAGFEQQLALLEMGPGPVNLDKVYSLFQSQIRRKKSVLVSDIREMLDEARVEEPGTYELVSFNVMTGSSTTPLGSVELQKGDAVTIQSSHGTGPVDALCRAVDRAVGLKPRLLLYSVDSVTEGKDARAVVTVSLGYLSRCFHGHSGSTDLIEASLRAYLEAVNGIERYRQGAPEEEFFIDGEQLWWE